MKKKQIILIGGGGHCKSCIEVIESTNEFEIAGIVDLKENVGKKILGYEIFAHDENLPELKRIYDFALITVGQIKNFQLRKTLFQNAQKIGFNFPTIKASTAYISNSATIGEGTIVMHHAFVNTNAKIGINNILNTKCIVEHDVNIGNHNHISTGTIVNGSVNIGHYNFIGSNSVIINDISINDLTTVGANSTINKNLKHKGTYIGSPIKKKL